jgi:hypothetical protein
MHWAAIEVLCEAGCWASIGPALCLHWACIGEAGVEAGLEAGRKAGLEAKRKAGHKAEHKA